MRFTKEIDKLRERLNATDDTGKIERFTQAILNLVHAESVPPYIPREGNKEKYEGRKDE